MSEKPIKVQHQSPNKDEILKYKFNKILESLH